MKWEMLKNKIRRRKMKDVKLVEIRKGNTKIKIGRRCRERRK